MSDQTVTLDATPPDLIAASLRGRRAPQPAATTVDVLQALDAAGWQITRKPAPKPDKVSHAGDPAWGVSYSGAWHLIAENSDRSDRYANARCGVRGIYHDPDRATAETRDILRGVTTAPECKKCAKHAAAQAVTE